MGVSVCVVGLQYLLLKPYIRTADTLGTSFLQILTKENNEKEVPLTYWKIIIQ